MDASEAYRILSDPLERQQYDALLVYSALGADTVI
jgi:DnaJ-class molecular chaperone